MDYKAQLYIRFLILSSICILNPSSTLLSKAVSKIVPKIPDTTKPEEVRKLFKKYGVVDSKRLCTSIDHKTNRIYAEAVCREVIKRLYGVGNPTGFTWAMSSFCVDEKQKNSVRAVDCEYRTKKAWVTQHARNNYYYVSNRSGFFLGFFQIKIKENDYLPVVIKESSNRVEADNIFGYYGVGVFKNRNADGHVCKPTSKGAKTIIGEKHCKYVLAQLKLEPIKEQPFYKTSCSCEKLMRYIPDVCHGCPVQSGPLYHAKCWYREKGLYHQYLDKRLLITNSKENEYYYISELVRNPRDEDKLDFGVVRVMRIPNKEIIVKL